jgi:hypothetical protein
MIIILRYRGPNDIVVAAMMKAATENHIGIVTWKYRSPVLSEWSPLIYDVMTARTYGGVVSKSVVTLL